MVNYDTQPSYDADIKENFDIDEMQKMIIRRGAKVLWEKSYICTCRLSSGYPATDCPICHGTGFSFMEPQESQMMLQSMSRSIQNTENGVSIPGTAMGTTTTSDSNLIGFRDRITFSDRVIPESLMIKVTNKNVTNGIFLKYSIVKLETAVIGYPKQEFLDVDELNIDYEKSILYPSEDMVGKFLSLNFLAMLRFYVVDYLREGRYQYEHDPRKANASQSFTSLPNLLLLRREDMYIPPVMDETDKKGTSLDKEPRATLSDESRLGGFLQNES